MIRICISGLSASGKTSIGEDLAKELNIMHITKEQMKSYKKFLNETKSGKRPLDEVADPKYAKDFDAEIVEFSRGKNCVVTTWLGAWRIKDATLRVWLDASADERARRRAKEKGLSIGAAKRLIDKKDQMTIKSFKKVYGIDVNDHSIFDIRINTEKLNRKEITAMIAMLALGMDKMIFK